MNEASEEIRVLGGAADIGNTSVSCDGTWQNRVFTSLNGSVAYLSIDSGKVVDVKVMSRYSQACVTSAPLEKSDPDKFEDFQAHHKPDCRITHMDSASAIEAVGTMNILKRSKDKRGCDMLTFMETAIQKVSVLLKIYVLVLK